jgi:hypothetical protein
MVSIDKVNADFALVPFGFAIAIPAPGAALNFLHPLVIVPADDAVMNHHQAAAPLEEIFEQGLFGSRYFHPILRVDNQYVSCFELRGSRKIERAIHFHASLLQQRRPLFQKSRMVVLIGAMSLYTGANKYAQRLGGAGLHGQERRGQ